ncbi:O-antigen ligase [Rhizobium sp. SSA_523]|uniref:O-antigen ligase family protein n=1 Tax=Rhizobium sp. SSA_523 TaxID=2952477 RepID=UPI002091BEC9|nr:O-antigen ligase family protein [Rhizobium sp. SSA_523]MCO5730683.1 O-antigen ligase family protein [Rhizobium sp. SSA_523]WKC24489.1 O-antigen ligase family protein [Rhizobium sp. SSA_523]
MTGAVDSRSRLLKPQLAGVRLFGSALVFAGVFLSGFVISEPAPYELLMAVQIALWFLLGLKISKTVGALLIFFLLFNIGGLFSLTVMGDLTGAPMYIAVSLFLALSSVFYAAIVEDDHRRLVLICQAWVLGATLTSLLGILGYFHAFPGAEIFTLYDRAKGAFQDPNVFGPYLVAPALYLMYRILSAPLARTLLYLPGLLILVLGIFLSFSRAAWALFAFAGLALVVIMLLKERTAAFRLKIFTLAIAAIVVVLLAIAGAMQSKKVSDLFLSRAKLVQDYDDSRLGRFERHKIGFLMSMERPLGMGPMVLGKTFGEDEHNIWLKSLTTYGWLGFVAYVALMWTTLIIGFRGLLRERPWQPFLMIAWITLLGHALIGNVIDIDHWRHVYILFGIVWGCHALERASERRARRVPRPGSARLQAPATP